MSDDWILDPTYPDAKDNRPRYLTVNEVNRIVEAFPPVKSIDMASANLIRANLMAEIRLQLMDIEIVPEESAIQSLIDTIAEKYQIARIPRGSSVAISASDAFGKGATQMKLNDFHLAGEGSSVSAGLKSLTQLLYATSNRGDKEMCIVHFKPKVNSRDVYEMMVPIVEVFISDFILSKEIYVNKEGCQNTTYLLEKMYWNSLWEFTSNKPYPTSQHVLRITLNKVEMYKHRVTIKMIADIIRGDSGMVDVMYGSFDDATLDIFPNEELIRSKMDDSHVNIKSPSKLFLNVSVEPLFTKTRVKGIPGIRSIKPIEKNVLKVFMPSHRVTKIEVEYNQLLAIDSFIQALGSDVNLGAEHIASRIWMTPVDNYLLMSSHVSIYDAVTLAQKSGCILVKYVPNIISSGYDSFYFYVPEDGISFNDYTANWVGRNLSDPQVKTMSTYTYASAEGNNLKGLFNLPWVDKTKTVSNNMHTMTNMLGAEVAMMYLNYEIMEILTGSSLAIDSRHVTLMVEFMFNRGIPLGLNYTGISRQRDDYMSMAAIQRAWGVLTSNALYDKEDCAKNVGTSTVLGIPPSVGSNCYRLYPDEEAVNILRARQKKKEEIALMIKNGYAIDQAIVEAKMAEQQKEVKLDDVLASLPVQTNQAVIDTLIDQSNVSNKYVLDALPKLERPVIVEAEDNDNLPVGLLTEDLQVFDEPVALGTDFVFDLSALDSEIEEVTNIMNSTVADTGFSLPPLDGVPVSPYRLKTQPGDVSGYRDI